MTEKEWGKLIFEGNPALVHLTKIIRLSGNEIVIGRKKGRCDIVLYNKKISSKHVSVSKKDEAIFVTDCSTNGSWLNDERLKKGEPHRIENGDLFKFTEGIVYKLEIGKQAKEAQGSVSPVKAQVLKPVTVFLRHGSLTDTQKTELSSFLNLSDSFSLPALYNSDVASEYVVASAALFLEILVTKNLENLREIPRNVEEFMESIRKEHEEALLPIARFLDPSDRASLFSGELAHAAAFRNITYRLEGSGPEFRGRRTVAVQRVRNTEDLEKLFSSPNCDIRVAYWHTRGDSPVDDMWCVAAKIDNMEDIRTVREMVAVQEGGISKPAVPNDPKPVEMKAEKDSSNLKPKSEIIKPEIVEGVAPSSSKLEKDKKHSERQSNGVAANSRSSPKPVKVNDEDPKNFESNAVSEISSSIQNSPSRKRKSVEIEDDDAEVSDADDVLKQRRQKKIKLKKESRRQVEDNEHPSNSGDSEKESSEDALSALDKKQPVSSPQLPRKIPKQRKMFKGVLVPEGVKVEELDFVSSIGLGTVQQCIDALIDQRTPGLAINALMTASQLREEEKNAGALDLDVPARRTRSIRKSFGERREGEEEGRIQLDDLESDGSSEHDRSSPKRKRNNPRLSWGGDDDAEIDVPNDDDS
eukprot:435541_1